MSSDALLSSTTMDSLPDEVLCRIMVLLRSSGPLGAWGGASLVSPALVCRKWRDPAQRALFSNLYLRLDLEEDLSAMFFSSPALDRYRVSSLEIAAGEGQEDEVVEILRRCRGLRNLVLEDHGDKETPIMQNLDWGILSLPTLAGLSSLGLLYPESLIDPTGSPLPFPFRLSRLFLWTIADSPITPLLLDGLLASSVNTLDELHLRAKHAASVACLPPRFVAPLAARLRTLVFDFDNDTPDTSALPLVAQCHNLERLEISFTVYPLADAPDPVPFILELLDAVPRTAPLAHLVLTVPPNPLALAPQESLHIILASTPELFSLRRLDIKASLAEVFDEYGGLSYDKYRELLAEGEKRSISVYFPKNLL